MPVEKFCEFIDVVFALSESQVGLSYDEINQLTGNKSKRSAKRVLQAIEQVFNTDVDQRRDSENYKLKRFRLPKLNLKPLARFTADEMVELNTAIQLCQKHNHPDSGKTLEKIRNKIKSVMQKRETVESDLEYLAESELAASMPGPKSRIDPDIFKTLRHAILSNEELEIEYQKVYTESAYTFNIHPYGIIYGRRNYLVAYNPYKNGIRQYALSHIKSASLTDKRFDRDTEFKLSEYIADSFGVFVESAEKIILKFAPEARNDVLNFHFHKSQKIKELASGEVEVQLHCCGWRELCYHLFTWTQYVTIIEPAGLKKQYKQMLIDTLSITQN